MSGDEVHEDPARRTKNCRSSGLLDEVADVVAMSKDQPNKVGANSCLFEDFRNTANEDESGK